MSSRAHFFFLTEQLTPRYTPFPYTTLFRSLTVHDQLTERQASTRPLGREGALAPRSWAIARAIAQDRGASRSEEHTSELQSRGHLVCRLLLEKKNVTKHTGRRQSEIAA